MLNKELMLRDGRLIFPSYLDHDERANLRREFGEDRHYAWCTCREDVKLWYRLSKDMKFYPEEKGYIHAKECIFSAERDIEGYSQNGEDGGAVVELKFNPAQFSVASEETVRNTGTATTDGEEEKPVKKDEPSLLLHEFVRSLNWDSFNERQALSKPVLSKEYFATSLFGRMKSVRINGLKKALRDYNLNDDGWQFFYNTFQGAEISEGADGKQTVNLKFTLADGREYSWFTYKKTYEIACNRFERMYGITVEKAENVMVAGMRYRRQSRYTGKAYNVIGRLCIFMVNENGIYTRSVTERKNLDVIIGFERSHPGTRYFLASGNDDFDGYFIQKGKSKKYILTGRRDVNYGRHEVLHKSTATAQITEENIADFLGRGKDINV